MGNIGEELCSVRDLI